MSLDHTIMIPLFLSLLSPYYHYPIIRPSKNPLSLSQKGAPLQKGKRRHPTAAHANLAVWKIKRWQAGKYTISRCFRKRTYISSRFIVPSGNLT